jgi:hypothetical protein
VMYVPREKEDFERKIFFWQRKAISLSPVDSTILSLIF